jgi:T-complex protein 1 subunit gamma
MAGEMMQAAKPFLERRIHPSIIVQAYYKALNEALKVIKELAVTVDPESLTDVKRGLTSCIGTKFAHRWADLLINLSIKAVKTILRGSTPNKLTVDIKRYARIEKIPGGLIEDCQTLEGVMINKDITHPKMRREIKNPRILLLDCTLEYKKGES